MPQTVDQVKTNTPWRLKSRNESARKNILDTPQKSATTGTGTNPGKATKAAPTEGPTVDMINRNPTEVGTQNPLIRKTEGKRQANPQGSSELYKLKSVNIPDGKNGSSRSADFKGTNGPQPNFMRKSTPKRGANSKGRNAPKGGANIGRNARTGIE